MRPAPFILILALFAAPDLRAQPSPAPVDPATGTGILSSERDHLLDAMRKAVEKQETIRALEQQEQQYQYGNRNTNFQGQSLLLGQERANSMMRNLQDEQFRKALTRVTSRGKQLLEENKSFQTPVAIIAGAASFWFGATVRLFKGESFLVSSRFEGRARRAEFTLESPFLNSKVLIEGGNGINLNVNRSIASIHSSAEVNFSSRTNSISTEFRHSISPHLDFSIGASQIPEMNNRTDGRARIQYQFNF
jgi:hypothetical protein